jgi:hypothetical protein
VCPGESRGEIRVHLELFARRRVVVIPENVGVRPHCRYPLRTLAPTGVVEARPRGPDAHDFLRGLANAALATPTALFRGKVTAFVGESAGQETSVRFR